MALPRSTHPVWKELIIEKKRFDFEFLPTKLIAGRLILKYSLTPNEAIFAECVDELQAFFWKNKDVPSAKS